MEKKHHNVIVLGARGMLGHMVEKTLSQDTAFEVLGTESDDKNAAMHFNVWDGIETLRRTVEKARLFTSMPLYFINCIGITMNLIDPKNSPSVQRAIRINSLFPHELAGFAEEIQARMIHMSTDGVFAPNVAGALEDWPHDSTDLYGKTKSLGEPVSESVLNIRASILGPSPNTHGSLFEWFRSQPDGGTVSGYTDQVWKGVTTLQFAELCRKIIRDDLFERLRREGTAAHFAPNTAVSKYELLEMLKRGLKKNIAINPVSSGAPLTRTLASTSLVLKELYSEEIPIEEAITELIKTS